MKEVFLLLKLYWNMAQKKILISTMLHRSICLSRKQSGPHKVTSKSGCPQPLLLFVKKQAGRNPTVEICWLWTMHSLLFTQLPANMCISTFISPWNSSLDWITTTWKMTFPRQQHFKIYHAHQTLLAWFYPTAFTKSSPNYCRLRPALFAVLIAGEFPANHLMMKEEERVWSKGHFMMFVTLPQWQQADLIA